MVEIILAIYFVHSLIVHIHYALGAAISFLDMLIQLLLIIAKRSMGYYFPQFTDGENKAQKD